MSIIEMAEAYPQMAVTIKASDLVAANEELARRVRQDVEAEVAARADEVGDTLIPEREAIKMLGSPDPSTLYRWRQRNYLTAVKIGVRNYYTASSIRQIIKNHTVSTN